MIVVYPCLVYPQTPSPLPQLPPPTPSPKSRIPQLQFQASNRDLNSNPNTELNTLKARQVTP